MKNVLPKLTTVQHTSLILPVSVLHIHSHFVKNFSFDKVYLLVHNRRSQGPHCTTTATLTLHSLGALTGFRIKIKIEVLNLLLWPREDLEGRTTYEYMPLETEIFEG